MNENEKILHYNNKRDEYFSSAAQQQTNSSLPSYNSLNKDVDMQNEPLNENFSFLSDGRGNFLKIYYDSMGQNKYELFSNEPSSTTFSGNLVDGSGIYNQNRSQFQPLSGQIQPQTSLFQHQQQEPLQQAPHPSQMQQQPQQQSLHPLINQLIHQWTPNTSGTYQPFGEPGTGFPNSNSPSSAGTAFQNASANQQTIFKDSMNLGVSGGIIDNSTSTKDKLQNVTKSSDDTTTSIKSNTNNNQTRKRIVAEIKPMRMSYSDVLSKNVTTDGPIQQNGNGINIITSANQQQTKNIKLDKNNKYPNSFEKKNNNNGAGNNENDKENVPKIKKNTVNPQIYNANILNNEKNKKNSVNSSGNVGTKLDHNNGKNSNNQEKGGKKKLQKMKTKMSGNHQGNANSSGGIYEENSRKRRGDENEYEDEDDEEDEMDYEDYENYSDSDDEEGNKSTSSEYYNVRKNNSDNSQHHNIEKIRQNQNYGKKFKNSSGQLASRSQQVKQDKSQRRVKTSASKKRQKHEILLKIFESSWNYLLKFVAWLCSLIVDVVYLSFGIIYDRLFMGYQSITQFCVNVRSELRANSGRPGLWLKNLWKKFDGKFEKKSKWAFWRYLFKKKEKQPEQVKDYYKDGKLPTTADEAMKSLLNCKGKDAYSILGVNPNCSQEQIRKHYKKIAVLVHPDKNKQAGAEEAFKVLQRSFELIGETESRKAYDMTRKADEKAWSELNDLLVQLQTKISEAANTIRCSSCCLRHPRKPTGRKPFAARECSACKIRHPAREGDIWAETTLFGIRWKYLALMEGNVYDITEWAKCQQNQLGHLQPNSCIVQYKIVLGGNQQNQMQSSQFEREKYKKETPANEPTFDDFLNNIYAGQTQNQHHHAANTRRRYKKN